MFEPKKVVRNPDFVCCVLLLTLCAALLLAPTGFGNKKPKNSHHAIGRIAEVDNGSLQRHLIVTSGSQRLSVELLTGDFRGERVMVMNNLMGKMELDEIYVPGDKILVEYAVKGGRVSWAHSRGIFRLGFELILVLLFGVLLVCLAGWTGVKALLSFLFAALMIWKVMVPAFLAGHDPIPVALAVVAALTAAISFLVGGVGRKGVVTFSGAFLGLVLTCLLAQLFHKGFRVHGAVRPFAETLLYSGFHTLDLTRIFLAGIFTASSGAVMDVAMDIAASQHELAEKNPEMKPVELMRSGIAVGRSVIGTMATTLLLAYSGGYITMMMLFMGQGTSLVNIFNMNYVAAEVLNTLVGSFGLVTVAPFTAVVGGLVYGNFPLRRRIAEILSPSGVTGRP